MNEEVKKYLDSGLAESYVLGLATPEDRILAESLVTRYPEFKFEIESIEKTLEELSLENSIAPPKHLKAQILNSIFNNEDLNDIKIIKPQAKIVTLNATNSDKNQRNYQYLMVACFTLLVLSFSFNVYLTKQLNQVKASLIDLKLSRDDFASALNIQQASYKQVQLAISDISKAEIHKVILAGNDKLPGVKTAVFWDSDSHAVYINTSSMPELQHGKQYQLWALKDGKPLDAGVFDATPGVANLLRVKDIDGAQTFAVTVEPSGGLPSPTMETLCLIGNI